MSNNNLNKEQIEKLLPHREPMLLIDELINIEKLKSATAIVKVTTKSFFLQGHFPEQPVMPGVLIVEAFGQAAAALTAHGLDPKQYAGHSLRSGFATSAAYGGADEKSIMKTTGHKSVQMVHRYIKDAKRFKNSAAKKLGL